MNDLGRPHRHFRSTDSTNARAKELAASGAPGGLVVTADEQSAGRGRQGRTWFAPPGGALLYSALLRPLGERPLLPLAVPLAVCSVAEALSDVVCQVKWPNDVWIEGRKVAGILIEGRPEEDWAVIGVGLNVDVPADAFPEELRETATSLNGTTLALATSSLSHALREWLRLPDEAILAEFRRRDALHGRPLSWDGGSGVAAGIDDAGHLLVDGGDGERVTLGAGEVHLDLGPARG